MKNQILKQYMEAKGLLQRQIAQRLNISAAAVSQYLAGTYTGRVDEIERKIDEMIALDREKLKEQKLATTFVATKAARRGLEVIKYAHAEGEICVIYGEAGLGKTQTLKQYERESTGAVLIEVDPSCNPRVLLRKIADAVGAPSRGVNNDLLDSIVAKLKDSGRVLLIDEAELLSTRSLEFIRRIHDLTQVGVVLAGMPRLLINLKGKNNELAQLYSRVGFACDYGKALCESDLAQLTAHALGTEEYNALFIKASHGNARRLSKLMRGVVRAAEINQTEISQTLIEQYAQMLIH